jgi:hypothetical protein
MIPPLEPHWQAFIIGWFGCLMSVFPVAMLWLIGTNDFGKVGTIEQLQKHLNMVKKDNEDLRTDNILHRQVIDSLLEQRVQQVIEDVK